MYAFMMISLTAKVGLSMSVMSLVPPTILRLSACWPFTQCEAVTAAGTVNISVTCQDSISNSKHSIYFCCSV